MPVRSLEDWTFSINGNPHPQASSGTPKRLTLLLMAICPMTGILRPFSARQLVVNCSTVSAPKYICAARWTSRVTPSELRCQISWIWGSWLSMHRINSKPLVTLLPEPEGQRMYTIGLFWIMPSAKLQRLERAGQGQNQNIVI